jgi:hypothetical protein
MWWGVPPVGRHQKAQSESPKGRPCMPELQPSAERTPHGGGTTRPRHRPLRTAASTAPRAHVPPSTVPLRSEHQLLVRTHPRRSFIPKPFSSLLPDTMFDTRTYTRTGAAIQPTRKRARVHTHKDIHIQTYTHHTLTLVYFHILSQHAQPITDPGTSPT